MQTADPDLGITLFLRKDGSIKRKLEKTVFLSHYSISSKILLNTNADRWSRSRDNFIFAQGWLC